MSYRGGGGGDRGGGGGYRRDDDGRPESVNSFLVVKETGPPPVRSNICYQFQRDGSCAKGDTCRFEHRKEGDRSSGPGGVKGEPGRFDWMTAATVKRGVDGSVELVQPERPKAPQEVYADSAKKRKKDGVEEPKSSKKHKKEKDKKKKHKHKKKKDKDKKKKHKKEKRKRSDSDSDSSSYSGSDDDSEKAAAAKEDAAPPPPDYEVERIGSDDYYAKNHEFSAWLKQTHGKFFTELLSEDTRMLFEEFKEEWNAAKLPMRYYKGITVQGRR